MIFKDLPRFVYHATTSNHIASLRRGIDPLIGNEKVDFGKGYYLTSNPIQAFNWANRKRKIHNRKESYKMQFDSNYKAQMVRGVVLQYEVNIQNLKLLSGRTFEAPGDTWGRFVYNNRTELTLSSMADHNVDSRYDYVYGPLADGKTMELVNQVDEGDMAIEEFLSLIRPVYPRDDQLSLHTPSSVQCLTFIREVKSLEETKLATATR